MQVPPRDEVLLVDPAAGVDVEIRTEEERDDVADEDQVHDAVQVPQHVEGQVEEADLVRRDDGREDEGRGGEGVPGLAGWEGV